MAKKKTFNIQHSTLNSQQPAAEADDVFELDGVKYCFVIKKFLVPGFEEGTAKEALTNPELLKHLVEIRSGCIQQID